MNERTHLDLFSGIGGFALAAQWAGFRTVAFCEREPFCQAVLRKHWPAVPIHDDICKLDGRQFAGVGLLTGGFPCQPFSCAGKRRGKEDDRYLWPEMLRVIKESRPHWIVGENVAGIINLELDSCLSDLEASGYTVQAFVIPACAVDAKHRRDRVWIVGSRTESRRPPVVNAMCEVRRNNTEGLRNITNRTSTTVSDSTGERRREAGKHSDRCSERITSRGQDVANTESDTQGGMHVRNEASQSRPACTSENVSNAECIGQQEPRQPKQSVYPEEDCDREANRTDNASRWPTEPDVGRVANGIPNRTHRIRALGNAIVPQVAYQIIQSINQIESDAQ